MTNRFRAVLFDMDGVLVNSEPLYWEMNRAFFRELGGEVSFEEYGAFIGISATTMWQTLKNRFGWEQPIESLKAAERDRKHAALSAAPLSPIAGIPHLLAQLRREGYRVGLASSSLRRNIDLVLDRLAIAASFDTIVSGEEVLHGKPAPDIFLEAARRVGADAADCLVIEDSRNGVAAAKAAGMCCVGYQNPSSGPQDLSAADLVIDDFGSPAFLQLLITHRTTH
ncbi:MAG: HAD family phosphatase [Chitinophagaceae bacterium]|nr:MAG: HAD family phosphatase [Chitinophagaceae bacterium]